MCTNNRLLALVETFFSTFRLHLMDSSCLCFNTSSLRWECIWIEMVKLFMAALPGPLRMTRLHLTSGIRETKLRQPRCMLVLLITGQEQHWSWQPLNQCLITPQQLQCSVTQDCWNGKCCQMVIWVLKCLYCFQTPNLNMAGCWNSQMWNSDGTKNIWGLTWPPQSLTFCFQSDIAK